MLLAGIALIAASAAWADTIRAAGVAWTGKITGLKGDNLEFRLKSGTTKSFPLNEVRLESVDEYPRLVQIEARFSAAEDLGHQKAIAKYLEVAEDYKATLKQRVPTWVKLLAQIRLITCYGKAGRFKEAVQAFITFGRKRPLLASKLRLPKPNPQQPKENRQVMELIDAELKARPNTAIAGAMRRLRLDILLLQGKPEEILVAVQALLKSRGEKTKHWATVKEIEILVQLKRIGEAREKLDRAGQELPKKYAGQLDYWNGRVLYGNGKYIEAALSLMRVPIFNASQDPSVTAEALFWAGQAMEKGRLPTVEITAVYQEAVKKYPGTVGAILSARALTRLQQPSRTGRGAAGG